MAFTSDYRFARFTPDDHSAVLWVTLLLSLIYAILVLAVRLGFVKLRAHGLDDVVLSVAHVRICTVIIRVLRYYDRLTLMQLVGLGMWASLFASLKNGLGKSFNVLEDAEISNVQQVSGNPPFES
jgi:hypothetical protein